jgi:Fe-S oxidoreductase/nitrate reductase gamma subunit
MLSIPEKIVFIIAAFITAAFTLKIGIRILKTIRRGQGKVDWNLVPKRLVDVLIRVTFLTPVWRVRLWTSLFHTMVVWGFIFYLLVNLGDVLEGLISGFTFLGRGTIGNVYRLGADVFSVSVLVGMTALLARRFVVNPLELSVREKTLLYPKVRASGVRRDSLIVGLFILGHVGGRFVGASFRIGSHGASVWEPFASALSRLWVGLGEGVLVAGEHIGFWVAIGLVMFFIPYFLYSKHIHLFFTPINYLTKPERRSIGELDALDFEDETIEQFGAINLEDLGWSQILDAYACIMCNRCQDACPAYTTGKALSPAALEINKRYYINEVGASLAAGETSAKSLLEFAITEESVYACTTCGACTDICPVGNEPMRDILDIRRGLVLMENRFPDQWQAAFRGMERSLNPWNMPPDQRLRWAEGLDVPTIEKNPDAELLWWVGCAPATETNAQKTARAFANILNFAGVNFAVLGEQEQCTGDSARRAGNEYLFYELALGNVETLNQVAPKRIVTTCPHCLHTLKNEYPAYGGNYDVMHHTQFISELISEGRLKLEGPSVGEITYHDPCYLARHNGILEAPRQVLQQLDSNLTEMRRNRERSFCCGAGGGQMWKEEEEGDQRVNSNRVLEADATGADTLAVGCPFCMIMMVDAANHEKVGIKVMDIAQIVAERMGR